MARRLLLIDDDTSFHRMLFDELGPYGFEIHKESPEHENPLGKVRDLDPQIIFIAVEMPDKVGYSLCNKAKKGIARSIPVVLTTSSVPSEGFRSHRKLKVHADEYIDKRDMHEDEILGKVDNLVGGLGEMVGQPLAAKAPPESDSPPPRSVSPPRPVSPPKPPAAATVPLRAESEMEIEEIDMDDIEVVEEEESSGREEFGTSEEKTNVAPPQILQGDIEAEMDAAFAGIGGDSPAGASPSRADRTAPVRVDPVPQPIRDISGGTPSAGDEEEDDDSDSDGAGFGAAAPVEEVLQLDDAPPPMQAAESDVADLAEDHDEDEVVRGTDGEDEAEDQDVDRGDDEDVDRGDDEDEVADARPGAGQLQPVAAAAPSMPAVSRPAPPPIAPPTSAANRPLPRISAMRSPTPATVPSVVPPPPTGTAPAPSATPAPASATRSASPTAQRLPPPVAHSPHAESTQVDAMPDDSLDLGLDAVADRASEEQSGVYDRRVTAKLHDLERENTRLRSELEDTRRSGQGDSFSREREFLNLREVINKKEKEIIDLHDELAKKDRQILDAREKFRDLDRERSRLDSKNLELETQILQLNERASAVESERQALTERHDALAAETARQTELIDDLRSDLEAARTKAGADAERAASALTDAREDQEQELARLRETHARDQSDRDQRARARENELQAELAQAVEKMRLEHEATIGELGDAHANALADAERRRQQELSVASLRRERELEEAEKRRTTDVAAAEDAARDATERMRREHEAATASLEAGHAERLAELERSHAEALQSMRDQHEGQLRRLERDTRNAIEDADKRRRRELDQQEERRRHDLAAAVEERAEAENELVAQFEADKAALEQAHAEALSSLESEKRQLEVGLASARKQAGELETSLAAASETISARDSAIDRQSRGLAERDDRIAELKQDIGELEQQNAAFQEQVLKAYQKIKTDEAAITRAKKALAIGLTLLDEANPRGDKPSSPDDDSDEAPEDRA